MMLRILIVEDTEERQKILTSLYRAHAWMLVNTGHRAIKLLEAYDFDLISLDYNLRGEFTGADVALAIAQSRNKSTRIVIHSMNPKGVERISKIIPNSIVYPVLKMVRSNKNFKRLRDNINESGLDYTWR